MVKPEREVRVVNLDHRDNLDPMVIVESLVVQDRPALLASVVLMVGPVLVDQLGRRVNEEQLVSVGSLVGRDQLEVQENLDQLDRKVGYISEVNVFVFNLHCKRKFYDQFLNAIELLHKSYIFVILLQDRLDRQAYQVTLDSKVHKALRAHQVSRAKQAHPAVTVPGVSQVKEVLPANAVQ